MSGPTTIGGWSVEHALGSGDFASVFLVRRGDETGALKLCTNSSAESIGRFQAELEALAILDHPRIPRLLDSDSNESSTFIVMSLAAGRTLQAAISDNDRRGRLFGDIESMQLLEDIIDAVACMHRSDLTHRDIKDANIILDPSDEAMTLIDFGFCKRTGQREMRTSDSFFRAGSARFSPPSKLRNPSYANASHDVYAMGVLAYRMLTGTFPWSVSEVEDIAALVELQASRPLAPVAELNSHVSPSISSWISRLLDLDDSRRPTAEEALAALRVLRATPPRRPRYGIAYPAVVRDPLHKDIRITKFELDILNTVEMQRLRSIRQLGLTNRVYPGAEHSRLSHSIGSVARVEQILRTIEDRDGIRIDPDFRITARIYALVHDVTHIPFGHTIEDELRLFERHDENPGRIERLLLRADSEIGSVLLSDANGKVVLDHLSSSQSQVTNPAFSELSTSVVGADVLDYIDRDALFCGLEHRIDSAIFRQLHLRALTAQDETRLESIVSGSYGLRIDRELAVENILKERYALFLKVYTETAKCALSSLLGKALYAATRKTRSKLREDQIESMGDDTLLDHLVRSKDAAVHVPASRLARRALPRGLYRGVILSENQRSDEAYRDRRAWLGRIDALTAEGRNQLETRLAKQAKVDPLDVMLYCPPKAPGYRQVVHWVTRTHAEAPTMQSDTLSVEIARRHLGLWELWVFYAGNRDERADAALANAAQELFGLANEIDVPRRQGRLF